MSSRGGGRPAARLQRSLLWTGTGSTRRERLALAGCVLLGCTLLALGIAADALQRAVVRSVVADMLVVGGEDDAGYKRWRSTAQKGSVPFFWKFYAFDVVNADEVMRSGAKPHVVQRGPFVYRKYQERFNVTFPDGGNRYRFRTWQYFTLDEKRSVSDPQTTNITTLNIALSCVKGTVGKAWYEELVTSTLASAAGADLFVNISIHDLVFGYDDALLGLIHKFAPSAVPATFPGLQPNVTSLEEAARKMNYSEMHSGKDDQSLINTFTEWQGNVGSVSVWDNAEANKIRGSQGYQFHPFVKPDDVLHAFVDTTMRSVTATCTEPPVESVPGMKLLRFRLAKHVMENAAAYPPNAGYYQFGPSGVINRTSSAQGAPLFLSKPHFLDASPYYASRLRGIETHPSREKYDTFIDVQPLIGASLNAVERLQISVMTNPLLLLYPQIPRDTYIPIMWIEQDGSLNNAPELRDQFRSKIDLLTNGTIALFWIGIILGSLILVANGALVAAWVVRRQRRYATGPDISVNYG